MRTRGKATEVVRLQRLAYILITKTFFPKMIYITTTYVSLIDT